MLPAMAELERKKQQLIAAGPIRLRFGVLAWPEDSCQFAAVIEAKRRIRVQCDHSCGFTNGYCRNCECNVDFATQADIAQHL